MISISCEVDFQPMKKLCAIVLVLVVGTSALAADEPGSTTLVWPDGTKYIGMVVDGKRNGKGTIYWLDGTRFVGTFENDMRSGAGSMILPDGTVYNGYFENDVLADSPGGPDALQEAPQTKALVALPGVPAYQGTARTPARPVVEAGVPGTALIMAPVTELDETVRQDLTETIDLWAAAWSEKNVPQYLATYDKNFRVPNRLTRRQWEAERRIRIRKPRFIDVELSYSHFEITGPDEAEVAFEQTYKSNLYSDVTHKVLQMKHADGSWTILAADCSSNSDMPWYTCQ